MSKQIQIRRGTADEHKKFTGAMGEITMDTTNKTLHVHDGETIGGTTLAKQADIITPTDYIVAQQLPTAANGYTWYRKYKSGMVEQGGRYVMPTGVVVAIITFPVVMKNNNYTVTAACTTPNRDQSGGAQSTGMVYYDNTTTDIKIMIPIRENSSWANGTIGWTVYGMAA